MRNKSNKTAESLSKPTQLDKTDTTPLPGEIKIERGLRLGTFKVFQWSNKGAEAKIIFSPQKQGTN